MARRIEDPEVERGRQIIRQMEKLERKRRTPKYSGAVVFLVALALIAAILLVVLGNRDRFAFLWSRLAKPDSIPVQK